MSRQLEFFVQCFTNMKVSTTINHDILSHSGISFSKENFFDIHGASHVLALHVCSDVFLVVIWSSINKVEHDRIKSRMLRL
jgi:hypothetical protein